MDITLPVTDLLAVAAAFVLFAWGAFVLGRALAPIVGDGTAFVLLMIILVAAGTLLPLWAWAPGLLAMNAGLPGWLARRAAIRARQQQELQACIDSLERAWRDPSRGFEQRSADLHAAFRLRSRFHLWSGWP
ncbi:MAG: hypothetical protein J0H15_12245 [Xanthomonadales bacterium]|nr:hypothetical protein [Xanthomonadales bacterium]